MMTLMYTTFISLCQITKSDISLLDSPETDFGGGAVRDIKEYNEGISSQTALGRVGLPHDIGSVVAFLCSDDSKWINAQRIEVSGGFRV